jgi:hypothetical protein
MSEPKLLDPTPELPDDTPISGVEFPARIRNVLAAAGLETVGEVREISDETLLSFQDLGKGLSRPSSRDLGLAVDRLGQATQQEAMTRRSPMNPPGLRTLEDREEALELSPIFGDGRAGQAAAVAG